MKRIYLDYAAAAPVSAFARRAFVRALDAYGNPSSAHEEGRRAKRILEEARTRIARLAGVKTEHVTFTSGATEANTLAIEGHVRALRSKGRAPEAIELLYHPGAHSSVTRTMERLMHEGVRVKTLPLNKGRVDINALKSALTKKTSLISIEAISPETGMRHDLRALRTLLRDNSNVFLHVDASQLPLVESIERERLGADLLTLDAQKIGGVRGAGCLLRSKDVPLQAVLLGGAQERGLRSGTEAVALIAAFVAALEQAQRNHTAFKTRSLNMRKKLIGVCIGAIRGAVVLGGNDAAPHLLSLALPSRDTDYLQALLDEKGIAVGTKSACESDSEEGSRMALAETGSEELSRSLLRLSWGPATSEADLVKAGKVIIESVRFLDTNAL